MQIMLSSSSRVYFSTLSSSKNLLSPDAEVHQREARGGTLLPVTDDAADAAADDEGGSEGLVLRLFPDERVAAASFFHVTRDT